MPSLHFIITLYTEAARQLDWAASNLRQAYPHDPVTVITDGCHRQDWMEVCLHRRLQYSPASERLKVLQCGAQWWNRFFETAMTVSTDLVVKMDADTFVQRPLIQFPPVDHFGSMQQDGVIQGGFQVFTRTAVERILQSKMCLDPAYAAYSYWAIRPGCVTYARQRQEISTDYVLAHLAKRLSLTLADSSEIDSLWQKSRSFRTGVCVSHPHKLFESISSAPARTGRYRHIRQAPRGV